ncbi:arylsulfatase [candidate division KSB1 bacterium]|nr:arylsulfatase [candidate division KSB1 bacterium]RQW06700.1 MAG: arylsulfatase [candidate division KSB1 bacterium]
MNCSHTPEKPNILLIMADDMGYSDLGCYGSDIDTPHIDRLADEGLRFTHFYNAARCCPTRASLLTGLYPHQAGMGGMVVSQPGGREPGAYQGYLNNNCVTIAELLKQAGYRTLMSGKWHVGEFRPVWPVDRGFDRYWGLISGAANYFNPNRTKNHTVSRIMAEDDQALHLPSENFYMTDAITDHAVKMLQEYKNKTFFLYVAYTAPHWPLHALPQDIEKYKGQFDQGWDALREKRYQRMLDLGIIDHDWPLSPRDNGAMVWEDVEDKELMSLKMAIYAAQIDRMDQGIGRILKTLKEQNRLDNTLVLFLSDNGACHESGPLGQDFWGNGVLPGGVDSYQSYGRSWSNAGNTPFRLHKHWVHEGGISTPLIVRWPAMIKKGGEITHQVGHIIDLLATFVDIAGVSYPATCNGHAIQPMEGKSLLPVFQGRQRQPHDFLFWEHEGNRAVRHANWKLVAEKDKPWELYNLEKDRSETRNLVHMETELAERLEKEWTKWAVRVGVK